MSIMSIEAIPNENVQNHTDGDQTRPDRISNTGAVQIPAMLLPLSHYMSTGAREAFISRNFNSPELQAAMHTPDIRALRSGMDTHLFIPMRKKATDRYSVSVSSDNIQGVPVSRINPAKGVPSANKHRILINLHGGFFTVGAGEAGLVESIPLAALLGITIVSVDYRQGPEHRFPAASQDVSTVYRALLEKYPAANIGIFGASAGGMLTAMSVAWLQREQISRPGAVALLSAGATASMAGDSQFLAPAAMGEPPPPLSAHRPVMPVPYLDGVDPADPLAAPVCDPAILEKFPPVLLMTGSRAFDLSAAIHTHRSLIRARVDAQLQLWDGMWHCFFYDADLPESIEAYTLLAEFFDRQLGSAPHELQA